MKKIYVLQIISLLIISIGSSVWAFSGQDIVTKASTFANGGTEQITITSMTSFSNNISKILLGIGMIIIFVVGTLLGIKYMTGTAEGKAKVMDSLVPFVIGVIVIFGAYTIWTIAVNVVNAI